MSHLALTKLDVARGQGPIRLCVGYRVGGRVQPELPVDLVGEEAALEPVYETMPGWDEDLSNVRHLEDLPRAARAYIDTVSDLLGTTFALVSVGPERGQTITLHDPFAR
jgi:adenylosuccinate synthase